MQTTATLHVTSEEARPEWLAAHHRSKTEIRLVCYKKGAGKPSILYDDSVEEA